MCLSVRVYSRITLCKHRAFALNRQHRYSQLMFSLSGATPANRALYERASGKSNMAIHLSRPASIVPVRACACSYYNGPKLCVTLFHFLPFKSCFLGRAPASPPIRTSTYATDAVRGGRIRRGMGWYHYHGQKYLGKQCYLCFESLEKCFCCQCSGVT